MLYIDVLTLFPEVFSGVLASSILKRAQEKKALEVHLNHLRQWSTDAHQTVDDRPYGGGPGMVLMVEPIYKAVQELKAQAASPTKVILLSPQGKTFSQAQANKLSQEKHIILICGHYEGVDERVVENLVDEELSIGDYVLTGGELPALVVIDAVARLLPGVLTKEEATRQESFQQNRLDYPQYTRPEVFQGWEVPKILLSGNHQQVDQWRQEKAMEKTKELRPDLLETD